MTATNNLFARGNNNGNYDILHAECGTACTYIDGASNVYPVDSNLSCEYNHSHGIELAVEDVEKLGIEVE